MRNSASFSGRVPPLPDCHRPSVRTNHRGGAGSRRAACVCVGAACHKSNMVSQSPPPEGEGIGPPNAAKGQGGVRVASRRWVYHGNQTRWLTEAQAVSWLSVWIIGSRTLGVRGPFAPGCTCTIYVPPCIGVRWPDLPWRRSAVGRPLGVLSGRRRRREPRRHRRRALPPHGVRRRLRARLGGEVGASRYLAGRGHVGQTLAADVDRHREARQPGKKSKGRRAEPVVLAWCSE